MNFENTSIQSTPYFLMYSVLSTCIFSIKALHSLLGFPCGSAGKESACNVGDLGSIPGLGRSPEKGKGYPLPYSGLENSMDSPWGCKELDMTERLTFTLIPSHM